MLASAEDVDRGSAGGAAAAGAVDLVAVALDREADVGRDLVLQALDVGRGELEDGAAGLADEVVVVLALVFALELALAVEGQLLGQPRRLQELQRAVHGGPADVGPALLHHLQEVVHGEVAVGAEERIQDHLALLAPLEVVLGEVGAEDLLLLAPDGALHSKARLASPPGPVNAPAARRGHSGTARIEACGRSIPRSGRAAAEGCRSGRAGRP